ncbi:MAG: class I SAM-dependent methyltransferase [Armatimonadota bacterium]
MKHRTPSTQVAFGVEPNRRAPYELRQSRYQYLAERINREFQQSITRQVLGVDVLDVGMQRGITLRYLEPYLDAIRTSETPIDVRLHGVDLFPRGKRRVYRRKDWTLHQLDVSEGMPTLESDRYDIVICEQLLEHLQDYWPTLRDLERVLKPGGLLIIGVPTFPHGVHRMRPHVVRLGNMIFGFRRRGHVQQFSLRTLRQDLSQLESLEVVEERGFRIVSGGPLRPLEFHCWWWRFNRWLGARVPGLCTEVQVHLRKRSAVGPLGFSPPNAPVERLCGSGV